MKGTHANQQIDDGKSGGAQQRAKPLTTLLYNCKSAFHRRKLAISAAC
jgi:hypothetical protein